MHVQGNTPLPELDEVERGDAILLADSSVEGEDIASMLRARGFVVFDVALSLLESRVVSEEPRVIILDVDQPGAIERAKRLRELPVGRRAELFCVGDPLRAAELLDVSLSDKVFERPVDVVRLVERVVHVAHPSGPGFAGRGTTPPPMYAPRQSAPPEGSIPPISDFPRAQDPLEAGSLLDDGLEGGLGLGLGHVRLSPELSREILAAEERIRAELDGQLHFPTPSEEADCLVPPDLLIQLDEPLDALEDAEGTGGLAAALALSAASGSSVSVSVAIGTGSAGTGALGLGGAGTGVPKTGAGLVTPGSIALPPPLADERDASEPPEAPSAEGTSADVPLSALASGAASLPASTSAVGRGGSPALGIRLGELLGIRVDDPRRPEPTSAGRSPAAAEVQPRSAPSLAQPSAPIAPVSALSPPVESSTQRADELAPFFSERRDDPTPAPQPNLVIPPTPLGAQALLTAAPMSPPVRFQEPRDFGEGRAFDLRTIPPQNAFASFREPPRPAAPPQPPREPPPPAPGRGDDGGGISPAAASVRAATSRDVVRDPAAAGSVFGEREGLRPLARAVAGRSSGAIALSAGEGTRRVVFSDGDIVTAASEIADESLVAFLAGRGDIDRDVAARLAGKLPPSGRHAGAALIAQSHLTQDDLWPVLRAHAEWLLGRVMQCGPGSVEFEDDPPGRLKAEPSVFGGATGAEVFVEAARRVLAPQDCLVALGGHGARVDWGPRQTLLAECTLSPDEEALVRGSAGKTLQELAPDGGVLPVLRALVELEVLSAIAPARAAEPRQNRGPDPLDEEAVRQKVRAKLSLVRDGDYFALLGVNRDATSYEVRRAFLELRKGFEPARLLTPATVDLHEEVVLILEVVEEAFEILREPQRRERYRRAIEAGPPV